MLANLLAVLVGISSFIFYMVAFFYPEVHRRSDFLWSGLGMFYAVVLWFCAGQMTPTVLLGQVTAVGLLLGLGWQTLSVRREKTPVYQQTPVVMTPELVGSWAKATLNQLRMAPDETIRPELQTRTLTAAASERLRQSLDPRRRPTYDYEFVEDGLPELSEMPMAFTIGESDGLTAENGYAAPPSVEAEVLVEILPEGTDSEKPEPAKPEPAEVSDKAEKSETSEIEEGVLAVEDGPVIAEESTAEESTAEEVAAEESADERIAETQVVKSSVPEPSIQKEPNDEVSTPQTERATEPSLTMDESEDWGDDLMDELEVQKTEPVPIAVKEKPSIIQTPLILVGWVKDMAMSMTKPKPSKPVIEIPRRESNRVEVPVAPQIERADIENEMFEDERFEDEVFGDETKETESRDLAKAGDFGALAPEEENWEESNWDD